MPVKVRQGRRGPCDAQDSRITQQFVFDCLIGLLAPTSHRDADNMVFIVAGANASEIIDLFVDHEHPDDQ